MDHKNHNALSQLIVTLTIIVILFVVITGSLFYKVNQKSPPAKIKLPEKTKMQIQSLQESNMELRTLLGLPPEVVKEEI
jgi:hypothetical protein